MCSKDQGASVVASKHHFGFHTCRDSLENDLVLVVGTAIAPLEPLDIDDNVLLGACPDGPVAPDVVFNVSVQREVEHARPILEDEVAAPDGKVLSYPGRAQL